MTETMKRRTCKLCSQPMQPVHFCTDLKLDIGVRYVSNLWALDGVAADLTKGWACRRACDRPIPIENSPEARAEWQEASLAALTQHDGQEAEVLRWKNHTDDERGKRYKVEARAWLASQALIAEIGAWGPERVDETARRAVVALRARTERIALLEKQAGKLHNVLSAVLWAVPNRCPNGCGEIAKPDELIRDGSGRLCKKCGWPTFASISETKEE